MDKFFRVETGKVSKILNAVEKNKPTVVFYAAPNNRAHIASDIYKRFLYVVGDWVEGQRVYDRLNEYGDGVYALMPEGEDVLIKRQICSYPSLYERLSILSEFSKGKIDGLVITCESLLRFYPSKKRLRENTVKIVKGKETDTARLPEKLIKSGYRKVSEVVNQGEFSFVGDRFEVAPIGGEAYRVSFFGDEAESIHVFDVETRLNGEERSVLEILPATDYIIDREESEKVALSLKKAKLKQETVLAELIEANMEQLALNPSSPTNDFLIPYISDFAMSGIYDYLDEDCLIILDDVRTVEDKLKLTRKAFENRADALVDGKKALASCFDSILTYRDAVNVPCNVLGFARTTSSISFFKPQELVDLKTTPLPRFYNDIEGFFDTVKQMLFRGVRIRIYTANEDGKKAMINALNERDIGATDGFEKESELAVGVGRISYGFSYPTEKVMIVGINDVSRKTFSTKSLARKRVVFELPEKGDYVVHEQHGIGISEGMQRIKTSSGEKDFYVILYRGGDRLYLPATQLNTIEKYNGGDKPQLHKLGGAEFERVKNRVRQSVKEMAIDLLGVYRARYQKKGYVYPPDTPWQKEFEDDFEYTETDDQLVAISEIKNDMESGKIMDRLLCGDVGFGKTEVALRAIFKTVVEGKQAAILSPTTILAQQHYNLVKSRMEKYGFKIELLSRFVPNNEIKKSLSRLESGESSIVVATHRLLGKDVKFSDLGLLVLDEEQRFGVEHKEKLKAYRTGVNVLSLSATPIPRTLHMALSGIRDISTLETPPRNRMPVETYVTEYSDELLKTAITKEVMRGGQAFILYNRVGGIDAFHNHVQDVLGDDIRTVVAHGQMDENILEDAIKTFYDGDAQVLISTTIIENGIDLPNANTLFVIDADTLGLSQLYQLKGRVGRSSQLAYAYFTIREGKILTEQARQRLDALMANTELGSGFRIAMRDLEIRGAGNVLGREQHGQMEKVGYEMYLRLIKEGIDEAQGKRVVEYREPELKIDGDFAVSREIIRDDKARVAVYKTVAALTSSQEGQEYYNSMKKIYGESSELKNVIRIGILKNLAKKLGVNKVVIGADGVGLYFTDSDTLANERLFNALERFKDVAVLIPENPPMVVFKCKNFSQLKRIKLVKDFLEEVTPTEAEACDASPDFRG